MVSLRTIKKILVIDDDPKISKALIEIFKFDHFQINSIFKGCETISTIFNLSPDLILLDLKLPDMSGLELLKQIKDKNSDQPVIVMTGYSSAKSAIECVKGKFFFLNIFLSFMKRIRL